MDASGCGGKKKLNRQGLDGIFSDCCGKMPHESLRGQRLQWRTDLMLFGVWPIWPAFSAICAVVWAGAGLGSPDPHVTDREGKSTESKAKVSWRSSLSNNQPAIRISTVFCCHLCSVPSPPAHNKPSIPPALFLETYPTFFFCPRPHLAGRVAVHPSLSVICWPAGQTATIYYSHRTARARAPNHLHCQLGQILHLDSWIASYPLCVCSALVPAGPRSEFPPSVRLA